MPKSPKKAAETSEPPSIVQALSAFGARPSRTAAATKTATTPAARIASARARLRRSVRDESRDFSLSSSFSSRRTSATRRLFSFSSTPDSATSASKRSATFFRWASRSSRRHRSRGS